MEALFPGSFDPLTRGHWNVAARAAEIFDRLHIVVFYNSSKSSLFSPEERAELIRATIASDSAAAADKFTVGAYSGLTAEYCREKDLRLIVRGVRGAADLEYERGIADVNRRLLPRLETLFLAADARYHDISSSVIKELARYRRPELAEMVPGPWVEPLYARLRPAQS